MELETHLNIKHLAPYLSYEPTFYVDMEDFTNGNSKPELRKFTLDSQNLKLCIFYGKLALRPLSDLTKEIEVNGEKFVPIIELSGYKDLKGELSFGYSQNKYFVKIRIQSTNEWAFHAVPSDLNSMDYFTVQKLYEWHFDIHGLIEKGLAIDINTLEK